MNLGPNFVFGTVIHRVRDIRRSIDWYERRLGLVAFDVHTSDPRDTHALFQIGSTVLTLLQAAPGEQLEKLGSRGATHIVWLVEDIDDTWERLVEREAEPKPIFEYGPYRQFYLFDPDGNRIEIAEIFRPLPWEAGPDRGI